MNCWISDSNSVTPVVWVKISGADTQDLNDGTFPFDIQISLQGENGVLTVVRAEISFTKDVTSARS